LNAAACTASRRYSLICLHLDYPRPYREREIMAANKKIRRDNAVLNAAHAAWTGAADCDGAANRHRRPAWPR
jgi:hypothetical protein